MAQISNAQPSSRMVWLDALRLLAGLSMVGLHASSDISGQPFPEFEPVERIGPVLFRAIVYTARTELFLIISLFLLTMSLDRRDRSYVQTVQEQARRLLVPFAFWALFYAFYRLLKASYFGYDAAILDQLQNPMNWMAYFTLGSVQYHMHFLPTLFGLVLFFPLYKIAVRTPAFGLVILICLFAKREIDGWIWSQLREIEGFEFLVRGVKLMTYAGYGIVAASFYGLLKSGVSNDRLRDYGKLAILIGVLLFGLKLVYSHKVVLSGNWEYNYDPAFWADFLMPVVLFMAALGFRDAPWPDVISKIAPYSFGIYLVHPALLDVAEIYLWDKGFSPSLYVALKVAFGLVATSLVVYFISKFRFLAWTVGLGPLPNLRFLTPSLRLTKRD